jgi:hypothetical protein
MFADASWSDCALGERIADRAHAASRERLRKPNADHIVEIEDGDPESRHVEQARFRVRIRFERPVVVEMVLRQVGEERAVERDPVQAPLVETVRGRLHGDALRAFAAQLGESAMQFDRIRRGVGFGGKRAWKPAAERADHSCFHAARAERCGNPLRAGSLAVRAGNSARP